MFWRSRLVGRGRTTGNRVGGKTPREFESLLLRQPRSGRKKQSPPDFSGGDCFFLFFFARDISCFCMLFYDIFRCQIRCPGVIWVSIFLSFFSAKRTGRSPRICGFLAPFCALWRAGLGKGERYVRAALGLYLPRSACATGKCMSFFLPRLRTL